MQRARLTAADAHADEVDPGGLQFLAAAVGIGEEGVAAVDENVAGLKVSLQIVDHCVDGLAGGHHDEDAARLLEDRGQLLERSNGGHVLASPFFGRGCSLLLIEVVTGSRESAALYVEGQVLAHDSQADDAEPICAHVLSPYAAEPRPSGGGARVRP